MVQNFLIFLNLATHSRKNVTSTFLNKNQKFTKLRDDKKTFLKFFFIEII